jgi:hypothetical protein
MPFQARVFHVMIASPNDLTVERDAVRQAVHEWNALHSYTRKIVLLPLDWETHAAPLVGDAPQEIINAQVLKNSDLLIAAFWTRLGSPTAEYASGTVEEIETHVAAGKPAMLYFSATPLPPGSYDDKQFKALQVFKKDIGQRALYGTYDSPAAFQAKVARDLANVLNTHRFFQSAGEPEQGLSAPAALAAPAIPALSKEAAELLREAAKDRSGVLLCIRSNMGLHVQTNDKAFAQEGNPRSEATWLAAVKELVAHGLIADRSYEGETFEVTRRGHEVAELLPA